MKKLLPVLFAFIIAISSTNAQNPTGLHIINTFHIASAGGWDYLAVGPVNDWLYVSHGSQVNILNKKTGDSAGVIENTTGVHGIAFDMADKKGFTSNGRLNNVTVFDLHTNKILAQIATGQNPDAIMYEPFSKKIITCNGRSKNLSIIDPVNNTEPENYICYYKNDMPNAYDRHCSFENNKTEEEKIANEISMDAKKGIMNRST